MRDLGTQDRTGCTRWVKKKQADISGFDRCLPLWRRMGVGEGWCRKCGKWQVASGRWQVASGKWQVASGSGKWQVVASGKWQVASGKWQVASGKQPPNFGKWQVASGSPASELSEKQFPLPCTVQDSRPKTLCPFCSANQCRSPCRNVHQVLALASQRPM